MTQSLNRSPPYGMYYFRSGMWAHEFGRIQDVNYVMVGNRLYLFPFIVPFDIVVTEMGVVWRGPGIGSARVKTGFYGYDRPSGKILNLLGDTESHFTWPGGFGATTSAMSKNLHLPPGPYFIAAHNQDNATLRTIEHDEGTCWNMHHTSILGTSHLSFLYISTPYDSSGNTLPSTIDSSTLSVLNSTIGPAIMFKVSTR